MNLGIQIGTLVAALVAAFGTIGGAIWVARFTQASEHRKWERDLRIRIYSQCTERADEFELCLRDYVFDLDNPDPDIKDPIEKRFAERSKMVEQLKLQTISSADIRTFGALAVVDAVDTMHEAFSNAAVKTNTNKHSTQELAEAIDVAAACTIAFRFAVRKSLEIDDD